MEYRNLEITITSAKDLKDVNLFTKMDVYVSVSIVEDPRTKQRTPTDKDGGKSPKWNHKMRFVIDESAARQNRSTLLFQIMSDRPLGDKMIGEVYVPVKELLDGSSDTERIVSYSVRTSSGKAKGSLNLSYKMGDKVVDHVVSNFAPNNNKVDAAVSSNFDPNKHAAEPVMAYPSGPSYPHQPEYPQPGYAQPSYAQSGYPPQPGYPPQSGYPPQPGYQYAQPGYPQMAQGYGGYPPQQGGGYGYPVQQPQKPKKNKMGGMGMGLGAGLLGGLLIGDMVSDVGDMDGGGFDDMGGGFDF